MKTAIKVNLAIAGILTLVMGLLLGSNDPNEKKLAFYFFILTLGTWVAYIVLLLGSKHYKNKTILSIASEATARALSTSAREAPPLLRTDYMEDVFHGIIWHWHYKPEIDNTPRNVTPYCPECEKLQPLRYSIGRGQDKSSRQRTSIMHCLNHKQMYFIPVELDNNFDPFANIKRAIQQKLEDGSWKEVVERQRKSRIRSD